MSDAAVRYCNRSRGAESAASKVIDQFSESSPTASRATCAGAELMGWKPDFTTPCCPMVLKMNL